MVDGIRERGRYYDIIIEGLLDYDEWMLDDDYNSTTALNKIMKRMRERLEMSDPPPRLEVQSEQADIVGVLRSVHSALDSALGDTDVSHIENDDELREEHPVQWAAGWLMHAIEALEGAAPSHGHGAAQAQIDPFMEDYKRDTIAGLIEHCASVAETYSDQGRDGHQIAKAIRALATPSAQCEGGK